VQSGSAGLASFEKDTGPNDAPHALKLPCTHLSFAQPQQPAGYIGKLAPLPADHGCLAPRGLTTAIQTLRSGLFLFSGCLLSPVCGDWRSQRARPRKGVPCAIRNHDGLLARHPRIASRLAQMRYAPAARAPSLDQCCRIWGSQWAPEQLPSGTSCNPHLACSRCDARVNVARRFERCTGQFREQEPLGEEPTMARGLSRARIGGRAGEVLRVRVERDHVAESC
jgi:hypothetical protein